MDLTDRPADLIGRFKQIINRGNTVHPVFQELAHEFEALPHHESRKEYAHAVQNALDEVVLSEGQIKACRSSDWRLDIIALSLFEEKSLAPNPKERIQLIQMEFNRVTASEFSRKLITLHYCLRSLAELLEANAKYFHSINKKRYLFEHIEKKVQKYKGEEIFRNDHIKVDLDRIFNALDKHPRSSFFLASFSILREWWFKSIVAGVMASVLAAVLIPPAYQTWRLLVVIWLLVTCFMLTNNPSRRYMKVLWSVFGLLTASTVLPSLKVFFQKSGNGEETAFNFVLESLDWPVIVGLVVVMVVCLYLDFRVHHTDKVTVQETPDAT